MPSTIQYQEFSGNGRYGETYSNPITIVNVRVVPKSQLKFTQQAETVDFNSMLFIDVKTSKQMSGTSKASLVIKPKEKDQIIFNGDTYIVVNATELLADNGKVHHYECTLNRK